jgi:glycosyltransferase involved in cell wall biosynthesis
LDITTQIERAFIIDPGLGAIPGYRASLAREVARGFEGHKIESHILASRDVDPEIIAALEVSPIFETSLYVKLLAEGDVNTFSDVFEQLVTGFLQDLRAIENYELGERDLLIFLSVYPEVCQAIMTWLASVETRTFRSAIIFQVAEEVNVFGGTTADSADTHFIDFFRKAIPPNVGHRHLENVRFFAISDPLADLYTAIIGKDVRALPMPGRQTFPPTAPGQRAGGIKIGLFRRSVTQTSSAMMAQVVRTVLARYGDAIFDLHLGVKNEMAEISDSKGTLGGRVNCREGHISDEEMDELIADLDICCMPYALRTHRLMPSATFTQALRLGKVVVVPEGSTMHIEARRIRAGYTTFRECSAPAIVGALERAIDRHEELAWRSWVAHRSFGGQHNIDQFIARLIAGAFAA